jgi:hypothetical protein
LPAYALKALDHYQTQVEKLEMKVKCHEEKEVVLTARIREYDAVITGYLDENLLIRKAHAEDMKTMWEEYKRELRNEVRRVAGVYQKEEGDLEGKLPRTISSLGVKTEVVEDDKKALAGTLPLEMAVGKRRRPYKRERTSMRKKQRQDAAA